MVKRTLHFSNPAHLYTRNDQLVVDLKTEERSTKTLPIEDVGIVVLEHPHITLSTGLLEKLIQNNVAVLTCDSRYMPSGRQQHANRKNPHATGSQRATQKAIVATNGKSKN